jgi:hypothetical protein
VAPPPHSSIFIPNFIRSFEGGRGQIHRRTQTLWFFFSIGFYSRYRTLAFLNGLIDPQTFSRTPWLGDQSNTRPLPKHRTTQHRNTQTHIHALSRIRTCDLNVQAVVDSTCLRPLGYWDRHRHYDIWLNFLIELGNFATRPVNMSCLSFCGPLLV